MFHNKMTKQEQQNGIVHASYSELQLEELETIAAAALVRIWEDPWCVWEDREDPWWKFLVMG